MKYLAIASALAAVTSAHPSWAGLVPMECASMQRSLQQALTTMDSARGDLIKLGVGIPNIVSSAGTAPVGDAAYSFEAKRAALAENIKSFIESGDIFAAELRKCSH